MSKKFRIAPFRHIVLFCSAAVILLFHALKSYRPLMVILANRLLRPLRLTLSYASSAVSFSVAELLIAVSLALLLIYEFRGIHSLIKFRFRKNEKRNALRYKLILTPVTFIAAVYAGFCLLWGVYYYGDNFAVQSGLKAEPVSVDRLETVTGYFADLASRYSVKMKRDFDGVCEMDRKSVLKKSGSLYSGIVRTYPSLAGSNARVKGILCSKVMSLLDFTGFYFPFTGEANVNMDSPSFMLPATVAHELAHCHGVAKEDEANYLAVLVCLGSGEDEYIYSAALMAYSYLANSLYSADSMAWRRISDGLTSEAKRDLLADGNYWAKYRTGAKAVSNAVYESFLQSYGQVNGIRTYGECVDLLVNYYYPIIESRNAEKADTADAH